MCGYFTLEPTVIFIMYVKKMKKRFTNDEDINLPNVINIKRIIFKI